MGLYYTVSRPPCFMMWILYLERRPFIVKHGLKLLSHCFSTTVAAPWSATITKTTNGCCSLSCRPAMAAPAQGSPASTPVCRSSCHGSRTPWPKTRSTLTSQRCASARPGTSLSCEKYPSTLTSQMHVLHTITLVHGIFNSMRPFINLKCLSLLRGFNSLRPGFKQWLVACSAPGH